MNGSKLPVQQPLVVLVFINQISLNAFSKASITSFSDQLPLFQIISFHQIFQNLIFLFHLRFQTQLIKIVLQFFYFQHIQLIVNIHLNYFVLFLIPYNNLKLKPLLYKYLGHFLFLNVLSLVQITHQNLLFFLILN